jgi:hypothetical protein
MFPKHEPCVPRVEESIDPYAPHMTCPPHAEKIKILSMCLVQRRKELIFVELILTELILVKSELSRIDFCLDTLS